MAPLHGERAVQASRREEHFREVLPLSQTPSQIQAPPGRWQAVSGWAAPVTTFLACLTVAIYLYWPLARDLNTHHLLTLFGDSQVWCSDHIIRMVFGDEPMSTTTARAGYPHNLDVRFNYWAPSLLSAPFRLFLGPLGAYNLIFLLTPAFSALAAYFFLRRATDASPWVVAAMSLTYGLCPYLLSSLENGQIEKAQLWAYPLYLLLLWQALVGPRRWPSMLLIAPIVLAIIFTGAYFGLFIPLVAAPFALGHVVKAKGKRLKTTALAVCALALTGAPLLLAQGYYLTNAGPSNFVFARVHGQMTGHIDLPSPVAQPSTTFVRPRSVPSGQPFSVHHITYIPKPLLAASLLFLLLGARGRLAGSTLALLGLILAFGPRLVMDDFYQTFNGGPFFLPAELLERLHYPTHVVGQYYRAISIAFLGLPLLGAAGLSRFRGRWVIPVALILATATIHDGVKNIGYTYPRIIEEVPGLDALLAMNDSPEDGAVLALPFFSSHSVKGFQLMASTFHGRPSNAMAIHVDSIAAIPYAHWTRQWREISKGDGPSARAFLRKLGFRYIMFNHGRYYAPIKTNHARENTAFGFSEPQITRLFGPPVKSSGMSVWDLGPTKVNPQDVFDINQAEPPPGGP